MKTAIPIIFTSLFCGPVYAGELALEASTLGLGVSRFVDIDTGGRITLGFHNFEERFESVGLINTADMNVDLKWRSIGVSVDRDIPGSDFSFSFGFRYKMDDIRLDGVPEGQFVVLGQVLEARDYATLDGEVTFNRIAPTFSVSYSKKFKTGWGVNGSLGLMFQGEPDVVLRSSGPLSSLADFQAQVARDEAYIEDKLSDLSVFPVASIGLSYRF